LNAHASFIIPREEWSERGSIGINVRFKGWWSPNGKNRPRQRGCQRENWKRNNEAPPGTTQRAGQQMNDSASFDELLQKWRQRHAQNRSGFLTNYEEGRDNQLIDCITEVQAVYVSATAAVQAEIAGSAGEILPCTNACDLLAGVHDNICAAYYRPAVAAALRAKDEEIARLVLDARIEQAIKCRCDYCEREIVALAALTEKGK
jgi:hypothetical protein